MKLYDFHVHTRGISRCSRLSPEQLCRAIKKDELDGFVLTNHYAPYHVTLPFPEWLKKYEQEYFYTRDLAKSMGLHTFFGIEVTISRQDFLIYGLETAVLFESDRPLFEYTLAELSDFVHQRGGLLIHAHPFRSNGTPADPALLDGYEVNCHPLYGENFSKQTHEVAKRNGLLLTCGSDFHGDIYKAHCGVYLPDDVLTDGDLCACLKREQPRLLEHVIDKERAGEPVCFE